MRAARLLLCVFAFLFFSNTAYAETEEMLTRQQIKSNFMGYFVDKDFNRLNQTAEAYRTTKERTGSGLWKLAVFYKGLASLLDGKHNYEERWSHYISIADEWIEKAPSPAAYITAAFLTIDYAWYKRGGGVASTVQSHQWEEFYKYLSIAKDILLRNPEAKIDPHWYEAMIMVLKGQGRSHISEANALFSEAMDAHPGYHAIYFAITEYLQPKWYGSYEAVEAFADQAANHTKSLEGSGLYARIYWYMADCACSDLDASIFEATQVDWEKMKGGIDDVLARYPDQWNINNFAQLSCQAKDKGATKKLLSFLSEFSPTAWKDKPQSYEECRDWAAQP